MSTEAHGSRRGIRLQPMQVAALVLALLTTIFLGCMSLSFGGRTYQGTTAENVVVQEGKAVIPAHCEQDVYYPRPFAHTPNLEMEDTMFAGSVVEQKEDHFRIVNNGLLPVTASWTARGVPTPLVVPVSSPPSQPPALPGQ